MFFIVLLLLPVLLVALLAVENEVFEQVFVGRAVMSASWTMNTNKIPLQ